MSPEPAASGKKAADFRDFVADAQPGVRELYRQNHAGQTLEFVLRKKAEYLPTRRQRMGVWKAMEALSAFVDESDPDLDRPQIDHALQTAESLRASGAPDWLVLTGLVHDLGKVLHLFGEPQWAVVGDTFPVGCAFSDRIVFHELFDANPDRREPEYSTRLGIYEEGCGLDRVHLSWGHDEYLYHVMRDHLPEEALYVIRYHSFYAQHRERAYDFLLDADDRRLLGTLLRFNPHDLYSKSPTPAHTRELQPYYEDLVARFLPDVLAW
ncbi:MAG: inositol oxygenase family protein [Myxococcota bacterium]